MAVVDAATVAAVETTVAAVAATFVVEAALVLGDACLEPLVRAPPTPFRLLRGEVLTLSAATRLDSLEPVRWLGRLFFATG